MSRHLLSKLLSSLSLFVLLCFSFSNAMAQTKDFISVDAARYSTVVAPNSIAAGFTFQVTSQQGLATDADANTPGIQLPTTLAGLSVSVNNRLAGLLYAGPNQINYIVPAETETDGPVTVVVTNDQGTVLAQGTLNIVSSMLSIFTSNQTGTGAPAALVTADGLSYSSVGNADGSSNIVPAGQYLVLFGTGIRGAQEDIKAFIGGIEAPVPYAGLQGGFVGLYQVNVQIPDSLANQGLVEVTLVDGGTISNRVTIDLGGNPTAPAGAPIVTSMNVSQASAGQVVKLTGSNFATSLNSATVRFGSVYGQVVATSANELTFVVPFGAASNRLAVGNSSGERLTTETLNITTSISGTVTSAEGLPLAGLSVFVSAANAYTSTDAAGRFLLTGIPAGINRVDVDASNLNYVSESLNVLVTANRDNELGTPVALLQDTGTGLNFGILNSADQESTQDDPAVKVIEHDGLRLEIPGKVTFPNGATGGRIGLTRIGNEKRLQALLPAGVFPSVVALITPPGATFGENGTGLATLSFPNVDQLPAGTKVDLYAYDRKVTPSAFVKKGQATVDANAARVVAQSLIDVATVWFIGLPLDQAQITKVVGRVVDANDKPVSGARVFVRGRGAATDSSGKFVINAVRAKNEEELNVEAFFFTPGGVALKTSKRVKAVVPGETNAGDLKLPTEPPLVVLIRPAEVKFKAGENAMMNVVLSKPQSQDVSVSLTKVEGVALTFTPSAVTIPAGKTEAEFKVTGNAAGRAVVAASVSSTVNGLTAEQIRSGRAVVFVFAEAPVLGNITPNTGAPDTPFVITGSGFASEAKYNQIIFQQGDRRVPVDPSKVGVVTSPNGVVGLKGIVPGLKAGDAEVFVMKWQEGMVSVPSNKLTFKVTEAPSPVLTELKPVEGLPSSQFTLTGTGFDIDPRRNGVFFKLGDRIFPVDPATLKVLTTTAANAIEATVATALVGQIPRMPAGAAEVFVVVFKENFVSSPSNKLPFKVLAPPAPELSSITPGEGLPGASFTLTGKGFALEAGRTFVFFKNNEFKLSLDPRTVSVSADTIKGVVPKLPAGEYEVFVVVNQDNVSGTLSNALKFKVLAPAGPALKAITPAEGAPGTTFTISGEGFAAEAVNNIIVFKLNEFKATVDPLLLKLTANGLQGVVPKIAAGTYEVVVVTKRDGLLSTPSNGLSFKALTPPPPPAPELVSIAPAEGAAPGQTFTITGKNFARLNAVFFKQGDKVVIVEPARIQLTNTGISGLVPELAPGEVEVWVVTSVDDVRSPESNRLKFTVKAKTL